MSDPKDENNTDSEMDFDPFEFDYETEMMYSMDPFMNPFADHLAVEPPDFPNVEEGNETQDIPASEVIELIRENLRHIYDPEIPVNILDLGLIYDIQVDSETRHAAIKMTLTSPNCPSAQELPEYVNLGAKICPGVASSEVEIVWEPQWGKEMMSEEALLVLGLI